MPTHTFNTRFTLAAMAASLVVACADSDVIPADTSGTDSGMGSGGEADIAGAEPGDTDMVDYACTDEGWTAGVCEAGTVVEDPESINSHISEPEPLSYPVTPPSQGAHRPMWAKWGEYEFLPPQRYLHNLEHGGIALLYHPCAPTETVDALREIARARPEDDGGEFRWVLTPSPDLPTEVAVLAWQWTYSANCVDADAINGFIDAHYRKAGEDVASSGRFDRLWIGN